MKKIWLIPIILICLLGVLYGIGRISGTIRTYTIPTQSNEPTIKIRDRIWVSNLVSPKRFDFICFLQEKGEGWDHGTWLMRLFGLPGDSIQIRNGTLFVNGHDADSGLNLKKEFVLPGNELNKISENYLREHRQEVWAAENDSMGIFLETSLFKKKSLTGRMVIRVGVDEEIQKLYKHPWNADNFGPVFVPEGYYFVLGDNRHGAADSRYTGFINKRNFIGTVLNIK